MISFLPSICYGNWELYFVLVKDFMSSDGIKCRCYKVSGKIRTQWRYLHRVPQSVFCERHLPSTCLLTESNNTIFPALYKSTHHEPLVHKLQPENTSDLFGPPTIS